jgi:hypothetical protein
MKTRITNPAVGVAGAMEALQALGETDETGEWKPDA